MNELSRKVDSDAGVVSARQGRSGRGGTSSLPSPLLGGPTLHPWAKECWLMYILIFKCQSLPTYLMHKEQRWFHVTAPPSQVGGNHLPQCPEVTATQLLLCSGVQIFTLHQQMCLSSVFSLCLITIQMSSLLGCVIHSTNSCQAHEMFLSSLQQNLLGLWARHQGARQEGTVGRAI